MGGVETALAEHAFGGDWTSDALAGVRKYLGAPFRSTIQARRASE